MSKTMIDTNMKRSVILLVQRGEITWKPQVILFNVKGLLASKDGQEHVDNLGINVCSGCCVLA